MTQTRLILIRHGITDWNKQRRYCGCKDIGLSNQGKVQAQNLRQNLRAINFHKVYSSHKKRAVQTARIIFKGFKITKLKELQEMNFGVFEGLNYKEIMEKYPHIYSKWLANPFKNSITRAEKIAAFKKRVNSAIKKIVRINPAKTIAVVCHGGTIGIFVSSIRRCKDFWRYVPATASITVVEHKKGRFRLRQFNNTSHLR